MGRYNDIRLEAIQWGLDLYETKEIIQNIHAKEEVFEVSNLLFVHHMSGEALQADRSGLLYRFKYLSDMDDYHVFLVYQSDGCRLKYTQKAKELLQV